MSGPPVVNVKTPGSGSAAAAAAGGAALFSPDKRALLSPQVPVSPATRASASLVPWGVQHVWTPLESLLLMHAVEKNGNNWVGVARSMRGSVPAGTARAPLAKALYSQKECAKYYTALTVDKSTKSQRRTRAAGVAEPGQRVLRKLRDQRRAELKESMEAHDAVVAELRAQIARLQAMHDAAEVKAMLTDDLPTSEKHDMISTMSRAPIFKTHDGTIVELPLTGTPRPIPVPAQRAQAIAATAAAIAPTPPAATAAAPAPPPDSLSKEETKRAAESLTVVVPERDTDKESAGETKQAKTPRSSRSQTKNNRKRTIGDRDKDDEANQGDAPDTPRTRRRSQRQTGEGEASGGSDGGGAGDAEATTPRRSTRLTPRAGSEGEAGDESLEPSAKRQKRETDDGATGGGDGDGDGDGPGTGDDPSGAVGHAAAKGDDGSNGGSGGGGNDDDGDEEEDDSVPQSPRKSTRRRAVSVKAAEAAEAAESDSSASRRKKKKSSAKSATPKKADKQKAGSMSGTETKVADGGSDGDVSGLRAGSTTKSSGGASEGKGPDGNGGEDAGDNDGDNDGEKSDGSVSRDEGLSGPALAALRRRRRELGDSMEGRALRMALKEIFQKIWVHKCAPLFRHPVTKSIAEFYPDIVFQGVCLKDIRTKLEDQDYHIAHNGLGIVRDFLHMTANAAIFNPEGTDVYNEAMELKKYGLGLLAPYAGDALRIIDDEEKKVGADGDGGNEAAPTTTATEPKKQKKAKKASKTKDTKKGKKLSKRDKERERKRKKKAEKEAAAAAAAAAATSGDAGDGDGDGDGDGGDEAPLATRRPKRARRSGGGDEEPDAKRQKTGGSGAGSDDGGESSTGGTRTRRSSRRR